MSDLGDLLLVIRGLFLACPTQRAPLLCQSELFKTFGCVEHVDRKQRLCLALRVHVHLRLALSVPERVDLILRVDAGVATQCRMLEKGVFARRTGRVSRPHEEITRLHVVD